MSFSCFSPIWFFGYDIIFEFLFAVIALVLALFSFRLYKITVQRDALLFSISFFLISMSYMAQSFFNYLIVSKSVERICIATRMSAMSQLDLIGMYVHMLFMTAGLLVLLYMTFRVKSISVLLAIGTIVFASLIMSGNPFSTFYLVSTICLVFITAYYILNFMRNKQVLTLLPAISFLLLFFGSFHFFLSVNHELFYAIGHFTELVAYILILINLVLVLKR